MESSIEHFQLSDHQSQILRISDDLSIMTWNILKRCVFHEQPQKFYNNGFRIIESEYEYHIRLSKIANEIYNILVNNSTIKCIALQEIPLNSDLELFKQSLSVLLPNFALITTKTQGFLYDQTCLNIQDRTADLINAIGRHSHKIQSISAANNDWEINFINVHLCWFKSYNSRLAVIKTIIKALNNRIIILGDFNFNILDLAIQGIEKYSEPNTTLCYTGDGVQHLQTCDGFIIYDR